MKIKLTFLFVVFLATTITSQIKFEKGYFITTSNTKVDCLIDKDFSTILTTLYYKNDEGELFREDVKNISEIKTNNTFFKRYTVDIDESKPLDHSKELKTAKESLLLEILIDGSFKFFAYEKNNSNFFYQQDDNSDLIYLRHKKFISEKNKVQQNNSFQKQLWENFNCNQNKPSHYTNINYSKKELTIFFKKYLNCQKIQYAESRKTQIKYALKDFIKFYPIVGLSSNSGDLKLAKKATDDFKSNVNSTTITYGAEIEFNIPHLREFSLAVGYLREKSTSQGRFETTSFYTSNNSNYNFEVSSSKIPLKLRYNHYINSDKILFINTGINFTTLKGSFDYTRELDNLKIIDLSFNKSVESLNIGLGFKYKRYLIEINYSPTYINLDKLEGINITSGDWNYENNNFSIFLGYNLF